MRYVSLVLVLGMAAGLPAVWAQEPGAGTAAAASEAVLTPEQIQLLNQKIDVGRIDIDRLRRLVEGEMVAEPLRLTLPDCLRIALESNPDLQVARLEPLKSDADLLTAQGEFDPVLHTTVSYLYAMQQASPEYVKFGGISQIEAYRTTSKTGVTEKLQTGTVLEASFDLNKEETTYNKFIAQWNGGLTLTVSQPLLQGRGSAVNLARVKMAKNARQASDLQVYLGVVNVMSEVVKAYWDLVGAEESLVVRQEALANAERLLDTSQKRLDIGTAAATEVLQSKAGVAARQSDLISARSRVSDAEDVLKGMLNLRDGDFFSSKRIVPVDRPNIKEFKEEELALMREETEKSIDMALEKRPEIMMAQLEIENARIERDRAANQMLPKVDVMGSVFQGERNHYMSQVFAGVVDRTDNSYTVGVQGSIPIGNRAARGQYQRAELSERQAGLRLEKTKQDLMLKVRLALRALHTSQILVESNRQTRVLQETNVAAEEKRLRLGVSTSYRVLQIQQDLTSAQTQEVQARIAYEKALVDLRLAEGSLLESLGIDFAPPEAEKPIKFIRSVTPPILRR